MKVATEDTKDDKTLLEQIGKAALVVMVPELYADIEDGDGNLGMYRSVALNADDDAEASSHDDVATNLRTELNQLRLKVLRLEKALKNSELEVNSWKLRCNEVETELRRYKGRSDDDSSVEADEGGQHDQRENGDDAADGRECDRERHVAAREECVEIGCRAAGAGGDENQANGDRRVELKQPGDQKAQRGKTHELCETAGGDDQRTFGDAPKIGDGQAQPHGEHHDAQGDGDEPADNGFA